MTVYAFHLHIRVGCSTLWLIIDAPLVDRMGFGQAGCDHDVQVISHLRCDKYCIILNIYNSTQDVVLFVLYVAGEDVLLGDLLVVMLVFDAILCGCWLFFFAHSSSGGLG